MKDMTIVATLTSEEIWSLIERAILHHRKIGEETATDTFLLSLTEKSKGNLIIHDYKRHEEKLNGADWAWWFVDSKNKALGFRVQAKIIDFDKHDPAASPEFPMLHYRPSKGKYKLGHQTMRLIRASLIDRMIPIYCLYTNFSDSFSDPGRCQFRSYYNPAFGVSLVSAYSVKALSHKDKLLSSLFDDVHAFPCFMQAGFSMDRLAEYSFKNLGGRLSSLAYDNQAGYEYFIHDADNVETIRAAYRAEGNDTDFQLPSSLSRLTLFRIQG